MNAKFRYIVDQLKSIITFESKSLMTDDDLIANIEAINLMYNLYDDLEIERSEIDCAMDSLYSLLIQRIEAKENIQLAMPLVRALSDLIFGSVNYHGQMSWSEKLIELSREVVDAYRRKPQINSADYLLTLDIVCATKDETHDIELEEYKQVLSNYLEDMDNVPLEEKIKRIAAFQRSTTLFTSDNWERWVEICEHLKDEDVRKMSDAEFLAWIDVTGQYPAHELKKRSGRSKRLMVSYLRQQIMAEFAKHARNKAKCKLIGELKSLNDEIIGEIIPIKIKERTSLPAIFALETIFRLRLQLAQITSDEKLAVYESLCRNRFEQIAKVLKKKYRSAATLNEKIEIVERLAIIGIDVNEAYIDFAIEEAARLEETPGLTYAQKLRLEWITSSPSDDGPEIVATLLPEAKSTFEIATLAILADYLTDNERKVVTNRFVNLFNSADASSDTEELGKLLILTPFLDPQTLGKINDRLKKISTLSVPLRRLPYLITHLTSHLTLRA